MYHISALRVKTRRDFAASGAADAFFLQFDKVRAFPTAGLWYNSPGNTTSCEKGDDIMSVPINPKAEPKAALFAEAQRQMRLAMLCGRLNCVLNGSDIWDGIPCACEAPTPAELVVWAAAETLRRLEAEGA